MDAPWFPPTFDVASAQALDHPDKVIAALGPEQHRTATRRQLNHLGVSGRQIDRRIASHHLHVVHRGVFSIGCRTLTPSGHRMGEVHAGGSDAVLGGWSGGTQSVLLPEAGTRVDVIVPPGHRIRRTGITARSVATTADERVLANGVPSLSIERLLLDLARVHGSDITEWAWRQAIFHGVLDVQDVSAMLGDHDGEPGTPVIRDLLARRTELLGTLRNRFELRVLGIIREAGLPEPLCNVPMEVAPGVVLTPDFRIPSLLLVLESDGKAGHADVEFQFSDAQRDAYYRANGYTVLRYGWWEVKRERGKVIAALQAHQRRRSVDSPPQR